MKKLEMKNYTLTTKHKNNYVERMIIIYNLAYLDINIVWRTTCEVSFDFSSCCALLTPEESLKLPLYIWKQAHIE